jgi:hypothetical protein
MSSVRSSGCTLAATAAAVVLTLAGCGGSVDVSIVIGDIRVARLDIALSRPGPLSIQVDWSDDRYVDHYSVRRNGVRLSRAVSTTTLIDMSVISNAQYCYQVLGYDFVGILVSASEVACIQAR